MQKKAIPQVVRQSQTWGIANRSRFVCILRFAFYFFVSDANQNPLFSSSCSIRAMRSFLVALSSNTFFAASSISWRRRLTNTGASPCFFLQSFLICFLHSSFSFDVYRLFLSSVTIMMTSFPFHRLRSCVSVVDLMLGSAPSCLVL